MYEILECYEKYIRNIKNNILQGQNNKEKQSSFSGNVNNCRGEEMVVVQINAYCGRGSTGKICQSISDILSEKGIENYILYTQYKTDNENAIKYGGDLIYTKCQSLKSRVFGNNGFNSKMDTKKLINTLERLKPSVVHLHNLHAQNCNLEMLFSYLKKQKIKVLWTFHDCWSFTAYCYYFDMIACEKWKSGCDKCPQIKKYSWFIDRSSEIWNRKRKLSDLSELTIITPSKWLSQKVQQSFWSEHNIITIYNGIDLSVFKPVNSCIKKKLNIMSKYMLLGVADLWDKRKGIDVFIELAERLSDKYAIVLVGTNAEIDKILPSNIISVHHTQDVNELVQYYSASDVFVNPTREEVFGMVNIEALACGTPVVTFDSGGSPECIDESCGLSVEKDNINKLILAIEKTAQKSRFLKENCVKRAMLFNQNITFREYIKLYFQ